MQIPKEHQSNPKTREAIDGTSDIYGLLRSVSQQINKQNGRRYIILIVRGNRYDAESDTVYFFRPQECNKILKQSISDHIELSYLMNSKSPIIERLQSDAEGVLGFVSCGHVTFSIG